MASNQSRRTETEKEKEKEKGKEERRKENDRNMATIRNKHSFVVVDDDDVCVSLLCCAVDVLHVPCMACRCGGCVIFLAVPGLFAVLVPVAVAVPVPFFIGCVADCVAIT
jgi:hypothetical protein